MQNPIPSLVLDRPQASDCHQELPRVSKNSDRTWVIEALLAGESLLVTDAYSTGLSILADLKKHLKKSHADSDFQGSRAFRSAYQACAQRLFVPIKDHALDLRKAPSIGWLERLYPDLDEFLLPFPKIQGLNSAWQWHEKGIQFPVLPHKLHPFYGTYFPTRHDHLHLFADWLRAYSGPLETVVDVGVGCGVLSFQLLNHGCQEVWATDINPNAIKSVQEDLMRLNIPGKIHLEHGDLFGGFSQKADLIVFNPPWLPGETHGELDKAIYYPPELFNRFFEQAATRLKPQGCMVLLFSNLAQTAGLTSEHPVELEVNKDGRFRIVDRLRRKVQAASSKTKRSGKSRSKEFVELWVMGLADKE